MLFRDRTEAGQVLAERLKAYAGQPNVLVLALPRGGVPVAYEVAKALRAPLDLFLVRKLGAPGHEELALGAIASGGVRVLNDDAIGSLEVSRETIERITDRERRELDRLERDLRGDRPSPTVTGKTIILIDDGLATGATMRAAVEALRQQQPAKVIVAVPVGAPETCTEFIGQADEVICARAPEPFYAVGIWYRDFSQTSDEEVRELLDLASRREV